MRQVPSTFFNSSPPLHSDFKTSDILVVGSGRVARHLRFYLAHLGIKLRYWSRSSNEFNSLPIQQTPSPFERLQDLLQVPPRGIILAVQDRAIAECRDQIRRNYQGSLLHLSGSLYFGDVVGLHPLMAFTHQLYDFQFYKSLQWTVDHPNFSVADVLGQFPNPVYYLKPEKKALYHACCTLGTMGPQLLWLELNKIIKNNLCLPTDLFDEFRKATLKLAEQPLEQNFTGPWVRGEAAVIEQHLSTMQTTQPSLLKLYQDLFDLFTKTSTKDKAYVD